MKKGFKQTLKGYYINAFPTDELGLEIDPSATFEGLFETLGSYRDVYEYIGVYDSAVRERLFQRLSEVIKVPYEHIYHQWLLA